MVTCCFYYHINHIRYRKKDQHPDVERGDTIIHARNITITNISSYGELYKKLTPKQAYFLEKMFGSMRPVS